jgi:8-oxo-dGTP diphosphatase
VTVRAVLYEEEDARAVAGRLRAGGFEASVARERFAGEDDDEDHPWTVTSNAPLCMVENLVEEYDGWLDGAPAQASPRSPAPLDLPDGPRRVKGHFREP